MAFINPKDEILQMILTQKGREQLSQGKLIIKYYAFHDDEIDYSAQFQARLSSSVPPAPPSSGSFILMEDGSSYILMEDGSRIILEV